VVTRQDDPDLPEEDHCKGMKVYRFPGCKAFADGNVDQLMDVRLKVNKLKRAFAPDLVHINSPGPSALFHLDSANAHPAPLLITLHGKRNLADGRNLLIKNILNSADWVTGCSAAIIDHGRRLVPDIIHRSSIIYNGLSLPPVDPEPLPTDQPQLLYLGRLVPEKGIDLALKAFAAITNRFPRARLVIAGDGPARSELEQQALIQGISDGVYFMGWVDPKTVTSLLNKATIVIMPSRSESLPLVALEAALMARPVVATRVGGLPEVVLQEQTGLLVDNESSGALAEAIAYLLDHPKAATQMGQAARQRARDVFSWERCVNSYAAIYRKIIAGYQQNSLDSTL
jgi:glycogen(starch) synthase